MVPAVAFILKGYPRLSESFIAQEILALEKRGMDIRIVSLRRATDARCHPIHREIRAPVLYLPEFPISEPGRVFSAWKAMQKLPGYPNAVKIWVNDLRRQPSRARLRSFFQALVLAHELPAEVGRLHAHFLHTPASVARYAAHIRGLAWSCSAHAVDIWTTPEWDKREKLGDMDWLATCTRAGFDHLAKLTARPERIELAYHGLDLKRFEKPVGDDAPLRDGSDPLAPVRILAVGRAVEKKGFDILLRALSLLPEGLHWRFCHVGAGPLLGELKAQAGALGLAARITWAGVMAQGAVLGHYRTSDLFVLPCRIARNGDRDGLPNVLMEAQSQGLACISTTVSAVPELIKDGVNGLLVTPGDATALAAVMARAIGDGKLRRMLGEEGNRQLRERFGHETGIEKLRARFRSSPGFQNLC
jgi:glycosyltransferase involved in cell wall biosynthesis